MEMSCKNLVHENQNVGTDFSDVTSDEGIFSSKSTALHLLQLPDSILLHIFSYLPFTSVGSVSQVCKRWNAISYDELLWRSVFLQHYKLPSKTSMPSKASSWRSEFKRLHYHTPAVLSEERKEHKDEVLHVSFSHDGTMFATCSKDGYFKVWESTSSPARLLFKMDMKSTFSWKFTQFSQFNENDTCLLVSGVYFGRLSTSGEIAVFNLQDEFRMQCRVTNKPYDVFGAWYDNDHLLSGTLYWTGDFNSVSAVWLSKASQEVESEVESVSMVLYRFENVNSSSIRLLHVAEVDRDEDAAGSCVDKDDLEFSEAAMASTRSSSLGPDEDRKGDEGSEVRRSRPGVADKCQGQEVAKDERICVLDQLLRKSIAEDEFDLENEDKTDDEDEELEPDDDGQINWNGDHQPGHKEMVRPDDELNIQVVGNTSYQLNDNAGLNLMDGQNLLEESQGFFNSHILKDDNRNESHSNQAVPLTQKSDLFINHSVSSVQGDSRGSPFNVEGGGDNNHNILSLSRPHLQHGDTDLMSENQPVMSLDSSVEQSSQSIEFGLESRDFLAEGGFQSVSEDRRNGTEFLNFCIDRQGRQSLPSSSENVSNLGSVVNERNTEAIFEGTCDVMNSEGNICIDQDRNIASVADMKNSSCSIGDSIKETVMDIGEGWEVGLDHSDHAVIGNHSAEYHGAEVLNPDQQRQPPLFGGRAWGIPLPPEDPEFCDYSMEDSNNNAYNMDFNLQPNVLDPGSRNLSASQPPRTSIATQTELATSRASSLHSLSHLSHSSSLSRDISLKAPREKLLIYTWGSETYIPHKIGIKRMRWTDFSKGEVTARSSAMLLPDVMENLHNMAGNRRDKPDVTIEMHGHIVGLSLSPDHKQLYVNCRPWPKNYIISDPQESPPLAQEVEISTIDLTTFAFVGPVLRSHKAYTHSDECFFLNLDVGDDYVASGAEDRQGYLWDRHYGIPLYRFPHHNVVNCVAINPQDPEMLVTVSDDYTFKIWISRCRAKEQREAITQL